MSDVQGSPGEVRFTIQVTRKETGKVEEYNMIGKVLPEQPVEEHDNGNNALDHG